MKKRMNIGKFAAACLAGSLVIALPAEEAQPSAGEKDRAAENQDAILDTIAQINHINWVVNVIKSYNNVIVLEEEYDKISPGNLYLDRIPDEETLGRITKMLDTLYSLRKDDRQMKKWRMDFRESRDRKIRDHKHKATKEAKDTIVGQVKECCSLWDWATNPLGSIVNVVDTAFNMAHYSVGLYNDYDNFVYELDKTAKDKQFDFDGEKLDLLHNQNKEILQDQWQFIRRYNLDDRLRVSDVDIKMLLGSLKNDNPAWIFTRLYPMRERFSLFPEYWFYLSCAAMETGHFKEGLEACDTFFKVNRGLFRDDPMVGTVAFNKAFMLPKTKENKPEVRRCLELAWTKNANVIHGDWQLDYLAAIMYKGVFDEQSKAEMMLEHAIALIEQESRDRTRYGGKAGVTLEEGLRNCRNALRQLRGEPVETEAIEKASEEKSVEDDEVVTSLVKSQMHVSSTSLKVYSDGVVIQIPNDKHIQDFNKFSLAMIRNNATVAEVNSVDKISRISDDKSRIVLFFRTGSKPHQIDEYRLVYNGLQYPVEWTVWSVMKIIGEGGLSNVVDAVWDYKMSALDKVFDSKRGIRDKLKETYFNMCNFYSLRIKGVEYKYLHVEDGKNIHLDDPEWLNVLIRIIRDGK